MMVERMTMVVAAMLREREFSSARTRDLELCKWYVWHVAVNLFKFHTSSHEKSKTHNVGMTRKGWARQV